MNNDRPSSKVPGIVPFNKSFDELNDKQKKFVDSMARGYHKEKWDGGCILDRMTPAAAYEAAGYGAKASKQAGWRLYMQTKHIIYKRRAEQVEMGLCAVMAAKVIYDLMIDSTVPAAVRKDCAKDILGRTGFDKPQEIILTQKIEDMSEEELDAALSEALGGSKESNTESETTCH